MTDNIQEFAREWQTRPLDAVYPIVYLDALRMKIRHSLTYVSWKERKRVAADLKPIYSAPTETEALAAFDEFAEKWDTRYPVISNSWRANWHKISPMFRFTQEIRSAIYTTNVIESLWSTLRKITKTRAAFPSEEAAIKLLWLGLHNASRRWTMPIRDWGAALNQFAIMFPSQYISNACTSSARSLQARPSATSRATRPNRTLLLSLNI